MKDVDDAELEENVRNERNVDYHLLDGGQVRQETEMSHELENLDLEPKQTGEELAKNDLGVLLGRREDGFDVQQLSILEVEEDDDEEADAHVWWRRRRRRRW